MGITDQMQVVQLHEQVELLLLLELADHVLDEVMVLHDELQPEPLE